MNRRKKHPAILVKNYNSPFAESFRTLRTNINLSFIDERIKTILITSPSQGEGKTTTCVNLGITISRTGSKVILVDGDLGKPTLHQYLYISGQYGLIDYLRRDDVSVMDLVQKTSQNGLFVLPCGSIPSNPAELVGGGKIKKLVDQLKEHFDIIIIDSPPLVQVTEASMLSTLVDGTILVVQFGSSSRQAVEKAKEQLERAKSRILGIVVNRAPFEHRNYYFYRKREEEEEKRFFLKEEHYQKLVNALLAVVMLMVLIGFQVFSHKGQDVSIMDELTFEKESITKDEYQEDPSSSHDRNDLLPSRGGEEEDLTAESIIDNSTDLHVPVLLESSRHEVTYGVLNDDAININLYFKGRCWV
ncbi:MAG: polysaccharide biosynthesis tyrosine autokinase, partial [Candidatus Syntrophonatronum acetioxidans]